jgi:uncharacterized Fe-S center protein
MVVVSHSKGHGVAGLGGSLKNLGMGCASGDGKREQHTIHPFLEKNASTTCGACINTRPGFYINLGGKEIAPDIEHCTGCLMCMNICPKRTIDINERDDRDVLVERRSEYAAGAVSNKTGKVFYINFFTNITPHCDRTPWNDIPIVPNIDILASRDPASLDKACCVLINNAEGILDSLSLEHYHEGEEKFTHVWPGTQPELQFTYAEEMGIDRAEC